MSYIEAYSIPGPAISANGNKQSVITFNGVRRAFVEVAGIGPQGAKGEKGDQGEPGQQGQQGEPGIGDMEKAVYDQNEDGVVDNAERLAGKLENQLTINGGYF